MKTFLILFFLPFACLAQESGRHQLSFSLGHAHIREGVGDDGSKEWLIRASWGFDYNYWFNEKWALGLNNDMILEDFTVDKNEKAERSFPFASCIAGRFKPGKHMAYIIGAGGEFAKEGSLFLLRAAVECGWELPKEWEVGGNLSYDLKWNTYDTWTLAFVITKTLGKKKGR